MFVIFKLQKIFFGINYTKQNITTSLYLKQLYFPTYKHTTIIFSWQESALVQIYLQ